MRVIELTKGYVCVISNEDYRKVNRHSWHVHMSKGSKRKCGQPYARANIKGKKIYMHRFIMGAENRQLQVDHKNHQTLDNRRENLEVVTHEENQKRKRKKNK